LEYHFWGDWEEEMMMADSLEAAVGVLGVVALAEVEEGLAEEAPAEDGNLSC
jgi:hypothetical protein